MEIAGSAVPSSFPKNYVTLRQLQELRLKEKQDEEERISNLNRNPEHNQQAGTEPNLKDEVRLPNPNLYSEHNPQSGTKGKRNVEERLRNLNLGTEHDRRAGQEAKRNLEDRPRNLNLEPGERKEAATPNRQPFRFRSTKKLPPKGLRWRPTSAPTYQADGGKDAGAGVDSKPPIGEAVRGDPNAEMNQKKNEKRANRQAGESKKRGDVVSAEAAAEVEANRSKIVAADPPPEESVQVNQVAGRNPRTKTGHKNLRSAKTEEPKETRNAAADPPPEKPTQPNEAKSVGGDAPKRAVKIARPGISEADAAAGTRTRRMQNGMAGRTGVGGGRGRPANTAGHGMVWVRKTGSSSPHDLNQF